MRRLAVAAGLLLISAAAPASAQIVRVSVSTDGVEANGNAGDVKFAEIKDAAGNVLDTSYYRWYKPGETGGYPHGLKYFFGPRAYGRVPGVTTMTDSLAAPYAHYFFQYDSKQRVTRADVAGHGASTMMPPHGGIGSYTYSYTTMGEFAAKRLEAKGLDAAVWNARFARPLDGAAVESLARKVPLLITLEEHSVNGGFGDAVLHHLASLAEPTGAVVRVLGVPDRLVPHGERADWLARFGLSAEAVAGYAVREREAARTHRR